LTTKVGAFAEIEDEFNRYVGSIVYATMVTVDANNRPRTRVLIPVWENVDGRPVGWLATFPTPVKERHLANNPHTSFSYLTPPGLTSDPKLRILRLDPFRVQVIRGSDLRSRIWSPETVTNQTRAGSAITEPANT